MENLFNMDEWALDNTDAIEDKQAEISISFNYPDIQQFLHLKPKERIKEIDALHRLQLKRLIALKLFEKYGINGTKKRPRGVSLSLRLGELHKLKGIDFVWVTIRTIADLEKIKTEEPPKERFYCVKMTVVIRYEGLKVKKEDIEKRFVVLKASSPENAYEILEKNRDDYSVPYLNPNGRLVKWEIESFDDCYDTDAHTAVDFDNPEGVEVFSVLKKRKAKNTEVWDGK